MNVPLPLLLKIAAVAATGTAVIFSVRHHLRTTAIHSLQRSIHHALLCLPSGGPPAILVAGFRGHGKSAFVNTVCRVLAGDVGPMLLRTETAPAGGSSATIGRWVVRVTAESGGCGCVEEMGVVELVDGPPLPEPEEVTRADVEAALIAAVAQDGGDGGVGRMPECVVVMLSCSRTAGELQLAVRRLSKIAGVVRKLGMHLLVVLTHKKSIRNWKQAEELRKEVALRARTDCVYFIENYTANCSIKCRTPGALKNHFDTHVAALTIIRQCVEFATHHRRQSPPRKMLDSAATQLNDHEL
ncbi:hypothetical protein KSP39_PZI010859 [Platanthera zijinensis]|uniref:Uncharacterized protein n=1 Tax=Platanthera zijinensis TaxID=2320716 RepID=A0AAP0BH55_9ASPA